MAFLDRTFCRAYGMTCVNHQCYRALTDTLKERGRKWWGNYNFPVSSVDMSHNCEHIVPMEGR